jgi:hypothetical protein
MVFGMLLPPLKYPRVFFFPQMSDLARQKLLAFIFIFTSLSIHASRIQKPHFYFDFDFDFDFDFRVMLILISHLRRASYDIIQWLDPKSIWSNENSESMEVEM